MQSDLVHVVTYLLITEDCINCRACDLICPSNAIYPSSKDYVLNNKNYRALSMEHYYIVTEKCSFCEGVHAAPECISICPMDAIKEIKTKINEAIDV
jgi:ferredoxin